MSLGARLKARRERLDLSVADVAAACKVSPQAVYQWENGDTKGLKPENLVAACEKLKTYSRWLVRGTGPENRQPYRDELDPNEEKLVGHLRELPGELQSVVTSLAQSLYEQQLAMRRNVK